MHPNKPIDRQDADEVVEECENYDTLIKLGIRAGLTPCGVDEYGVPDFNGNRKQWSDFDLLRYEQGI